MVYWTRPAHGVVPHDAVLGGKDVDGSDIYVGRANHERDLIPAKVIMSKGGAFVPYAGGEHSKFEYEVLCEKNVAWQPTCHGEVPRHAIEGGRTSNGEKLYIGRVFHAGALTPGKIHPSHRKCYIPFGGQELGFDRYEILVKL